MRKLFIVSMKLPNAMVAVPYGKNNNNNGISKVEAAWLNISAF